nr:transposase IS5 [Ralstonia solanacearum P673]
MYDRTTLMDKAATLDFVVEVVRRHEQQTGFAVLPRRWVVERTFGWMVAGADSCVTTSGARTYRRP